VEDLVRKALLSFFALGVGVSVQVSLFAAEDVGQC
jgi:hypothetical protein